ncbi:hypothetical protein Tco_0720459 [Tanacetum coccineum]
MKINRIVVKLPSIFSGCLGGFKELLRKCPHHGFSLMHQLDTFYNSLSYNDQDSLNSAAGGNFLYKSPTEGLQIIENKAKVRCSRNVVMRSIPTAKRTFLPTGATQSLAPLLMRMTFDEKEPGVHKDKVHRAPKTSSLGCPKSHDPGLFTDCTDLIVVHWGRSCDKGWYGKDVFKRDGSQDQEKWATNEFVKDNDEINHEVFKSDNENVLGVHDNEEEEIAFLDGLLEDENFFEMNDKKVESLERKTKEDFETKDEPKSKKELQVFHPNIEILNHFETTSYVGSDYVFYEDFNLVDMLFPMNIQGKIFDPGITFHEKSFENDVFKDKSSKELAPSKSLLTLDVFDPLHPPLMDFHVTKALSGFIFSLLKFFSKKFFKPGINNATSKPTKKRKRQDKSEEWKPILKAGSARYNKKRVNEEPIEEKGLIMRSRRMMDCCYGGRSPSTLSRDGEDGGVENKSSMGSRLIATGEIVVERLSEKLVKLPLCSQMVERMVDREKKKFLD